MNIIFHLEAAITMFVITYITTGLKCLITNNIQNNYTLGH